MDSETSPKCAGRKFTLLVFISKAKTQKMKILYSG